MISNLQPVFFVDETLSVPLCIMIICPDMLSPIPEPFFLVVKIRNDFLYLCGNGYREDSYSGAGNGELNFLLQ